MCYYSLPPDDHWKPDLGKLVHAFISSRLQRTVHKDGSSSARMLLPGLEQEPEKESSLKQISDHNSGSQVLTEIDFKMRLLVHKRVRSETPHRSPDPVREVWF